MVAVVGAVGAVAGGAISASGAQSAAGSQAAAGSTAAGTQMLAQIQNINRNQPFVDAGIRATDRLENGFSTGQFGGGANFSPQNFLANQDPGYGFQLNQGQQALQNSQAAGSGIMSGSALKGLIGYNQGMASTGYQNAYNRWLTSNQNAYSQLAGQQSVGQNAANGLGNSGVQAANGMASSYNGIGNAQAAGTVGSANALSGGISNGAGYYQLNSLMNGGRAGGLTDASGYGLSNYGAGGAASGVTPYL
jgi:hypothetical protein